MTWPKTVLVAREVGGRESTLYAYSIDDLVELLGNQPPGVYKIFDASERDSREPTGYKLKSWGYAIVLLGSIELTIYKQPES